MSAGAARLVVPAGVLLAQLSCGDPYKSPGHSVLTFELPGTHAALTCQGCHGEPPFVAFVWDTGCLSCHEADRKTPDHYYPKACTDSGCHLDTDPSWADNHGVPHDFLPLEGVHQLDCTSCHGTGDPSVDDVFPDTGSRYSCAGCHDTKTQADRPPYDDLVRPWYHAIEDDPVLVALDPPTLLGWDCNACHDTERRTVPGTPILGWDQGNGEHGGSADLVTYALVGATRFPHGTETGDGSQALPAPAWVVDCVDCHPVKPPQYVCTVACHDAIFVEPMSAFHTGLIKGDAATDGRCSLPACHPSADDRQDGTAIIVNVP